MKWLTGVHAKAGLHSTPPAYHLAALARVRIRRPSSPELEVDMPPKDFPERYFINTKGVVRSQGKTGHMSISNRETGSIHM